MQIDTDFSKELDLNKRIKTIEKYNPFLDHILSSNGKLHKTAKLIKSFSEEEEGFARIT